jgi:hypothetical protein
VIQEVSLKLDVAKEGTRFVCVGIQHLIKRERQTAQSMAEQDGKPSKKKWNKKNKHII